MLSVIDLRTLLRHPSGLLLSLAIGVFTPPALANERVIPEPIAEKAAANHAAVQPPELVHFVEARYPEQAVTHGMHGAVTLLLTIDAEGMVADAEVVSSAGYGMDEAATEAASKFRFKPARRNGMAVVSRITYAYEFRLAKVPAVAARLTVSPHPPRPRPARALRTSPVLRERHAPETPGGEVAVVVRGQSAAERKRQSAEAVHVIETEEARRESSDLGEVLAREQGISVRRSGGIGSDTRFSLHGFSGDQVRLFLDGIPLPNVGFPFGITHVPVNLVSQVEVYRGVVPIRFGADALGGAVNLVTNADITGTHGFVSYQAGSFGLQRLTLGLSTVHEPSGFFTRVSAFYDYADNDYPIDVTVATPRGRSRPARAHRFNDAYEAGGGGVEMGFVNLPWAQRLSLRTFVTEYRKELQHNTTMSEPYGDVFWKELVPGATLAYRHPLSDTVHVSLHSGYSYHRMLFQDLGECTYDWFRTCVWALRQGGEMDGRPRDHQFRTHMSFARLNVNWNPHPSHILRAAMAWTNTVRHGEDRRRTLVGARDPLSAERRLTSFVGGVEYASTLFEERLENLLFAKHYSQFIQSEEPLPGNIFRRSDHQTGRFGIGNSLRYHFTNFAYGKASYEWATRLPNPSELFGNGALIVDNLDLRPERSHNFNLSLTSAGATRLGKLRFEVVGFSRTAEDLILLLGTDRVYSYHNVYAATAVGAEISGGWSSPKEMFSFDANSTYLDLRNASTDGAFAEFRGDRIPNRPHFFANATARWQTFAIAAPSDRLSLGWYTRYVAAFFRGWESVGLHSYKPEVPAQLAHTASLSYGITGDAVALTFALDVDNFTDADNYDFFGIQRPGRSTSFKVTAQF